VIPCRRALSPVITPLVTITTTTSHLSGSRGGYTLTRVPGNFLLSMANIGSVFLGDTKRLRSMATTSTPPTSPPAIISQHNTGQSAHSAMGPLPSPVLSTLPPREEKLPKTTIEPEMSLELRLRWLEAIVYGVKERKESKAKKEPLARAAQQLQSQLNTIVDGNESLRRFMNQCTFWKS
jgi:hypothetical protein